MIKKLYGKNLNFLIGSGASEEKMELIHYEQSGKKMERTGVLKIYWIKRILIFKT